MCHDDVQVDFDANVLQDHPTALLRDRVKGQAVVAQNCLC